MNVMNNFLEKNHDCGTWAFLIASLLSPSLALFPIQTQIPKLPLSYNENNSEEEEKDVEDDDDDDDDDTTDENDNDDDNCDFDNKSTYEVGVVTGEVVLNHDDDKHCNDRLIISIIILNDVHHLEQRHAIKHYEHQHHRDQSHHDDQHHHDQLHSGQDHHHSDHHDQPAAMARPSPQSGSTCHCHPSTCDAQK